MESPASALQLYHRSPCAGYVAHPFSKGPVVAIDVVCAGREIALPHENLPFSSKAHALEKLGHYEEALAAYNKALQLSPKHFSLLFARADVLKKLLRYEEANADYGRAQLVAPNPWFAVICILARDDFP